MSDKRHIYVKAYTLSREKMAELERLHGFLSDKGQTVCSLDCFSEGLVVLFEDVFCRVLGCFFVVHYYCGFYVAFGAG